MSDAYMKQLERINARMQQLRDDPQRREADNRWKHNFINSVQAIKERRDVVSVASTGSKTTANRMKNMGLTDKICSIAQNVEDTYCVGNEDTMLCKAIATIKDTLSCPLS